VLCSLALDTLFKKLAEDTLFGGSANAGVAGCGVVIRLIIRRRLSLAIVSVGLWKERMIGW
jgi:hypothetical protein